VGCNRPGDCRCEP